MMMNQANAENTKKTVKSGKWLLAGAGILLAASAVAGLVWGQFTIPLGCAFVLGGIKLLRMKLSFETSMMTFSAYAAMAVMAVVGAVMLFTGLTAGLNCQNDLDYTRSLGVSVQEILATRNSEGDRYAVVIDDTLSQRLLPEEYRAGRAEEIGAVLVVKTKWEKVGRYTSGGTAYRAQMEISMKSLKTGEIIGTAHLYGEEPPSHVRISPLDPNKDRKGKMPSDEKITSACVSLIENARNEEERQSRAVRLSEEELPVFVRRAVEQATGEDGWAGVNDVNEAILQADPDFSFKDYGYADLYQYCKSDPRFAARKAEVKSYLDIFCSQDSVRWTGE